MHERKSIVWCIPQADRRRLIGIKGPGPRTIGDELRQTRLGEVDGFVAISELDGIWRACTVREQGPRSSKVLDMMLIRTSKLKSDHC